MSKTEYYLVGVDGGGSGSRAVLLDPKSGSRTEARGGAANVSEFDRAVAHVSELLDLLFRQAGLPPAARDSAFVHLGLAGVLDKSTATRVAERLSLDRASVTDDQVTTIEGALGDHDGTVAAIGTGSFIGRKHKGKVTKCGGWGFLLGDQASGAWLGCRLLQEALLAHDGIAPASDLTRSVLAENGGATGVVFLSLQAKPAEFAGFAPQVVTAAADGDIVAVALMREGATYISAALHALGWQGGERFCLVGGLGSAYRDWMEPRIIQACISPQGNALDGALSLARRLVEA